MAEIAQVFAELLTEIHSALMIIAGAVIGGSLLVSAAVLAVALVLLAARK